LRVGSASSRQDDGGARKQVGRNNVHGYLSILEPAVGQVHIDRGAKTNGTHEKVAATQDAHWVRQFTLKMSFRRIDNGSQPDDFPEVGAQ
jgi:hypothetical protein